MLLTPVPFEVTLSVKLGAYLLLSAESLLFSAVVIVLSQGAWVSPVLLSTMPCAVSSNLGALLFPAQTEDVPLSLLTVQGAWVFPVLLSPVLCCHFQVFLHPCGGVGWPGGLGDSFAFVSLSSYCQLLGPCH